jgi:two-component sensor histidine kinase
MLAEDHALVTAQPMDACLLVEELTHRIANEYAAAIGSLSLAAARCPDPEARSALAGAAGRLFDYAETHRALLPPHVEGPVELSKYLSVICRAIVRARLAERGVALTFKEETIELDAQSCWRVGMIVFELITNAARHGVRSNAGSIDVELATQNGTLICRVSDNGVWRDPKPGRGTRITQALARELGGRIDWEFGPNGTEALLCFPSGWRTSRAAA